MSMNKAPKTDFRIDVLRNKMTECGELMSTLDEIYDETVHEYFRLKANIYYLEKEKEDFQNE